MKLEDKILEYELVINNLKHENKKLEMQRAKDRTPERSIFFKLKGSEEIILRFVNGFDFENETDIKSTKDYTLFEFWTFIQSEMEALAPGNIGNKSSKLMKD